MTCFPRGDEPAGKQRFFRGWLRRLLGFAQIAFVGLSDGALFSVRLKPITPVFVTGALTIISRLIYQGRTRTGSLTGVVNTNVTRRSVQFNAARLGWVFQAFKLGNAESASPLNPGGPNVQASL